MDWSFPPSHHTGGLGKMRPESKWNAKVSLRLARRRGTRKTAPPLDPPCGMPGDWAPWRTMGAANCGSETRLPSALSQSPTIPSSRFAGDKFKLGLVPVPPCPGGAIDRSQGWRCRRHPWNASRKKVRTPRGVREILAPFPGCISFDLAIQGRRSRVVHSIRDSP